MKVETISRRIQMNILEQIMRERKTSVKAAKRRVSRASLADLASFRIHHSLSEKMRNSNKAAIIAEMKKASPSAGVLKSDYNPADIASAYARAGAAAISVLTEPNHFLGSETHLREVRKTVDLPLLRKDFICDPYQLYESAAWGADIVLLIAAALERSLIKDLYDESRALGLEVLVESHTAAELKTALELDDAIIGINSRNLKTLQTDLNTAVILAGQIPTGRLSVAESGIKTADDISLLMSVGYKGFLIGETLLRSGNPEQILRKFALAKRGKKP